MGDRTHVNYIIGGKIDAQTAAELAELLADEYFAVGEDKWGSGDDKSAFLDAMRDASDTGQPLYISADEVNWGYSDNIETFCKASALPFQRRNGDGGGYPAATVLWRGSGDEQYFPLADGDFTASPAAMLQIAEKDGPSALVEHLRTYEDAEAWSPPALQADLPPKPEWQRYVVDVKAFFAVPVEAKTEAAARRIAEQFVAAAMQADESALAGYASALPGDAHGSIIAMGTVEAAIDGQSEVQGA